MDAWQLFYSLIGSGFGAGFGAYLGFRFGLRTNAKAKNERKKDDLSNARSNLIDELKGIRVLFSGNEAARKIIHFETPIWNAVVYP